MKGDDLRAEANANLVEWEQAEPRSRAEHEAAEAFTRAWAELDALMREGKEPPPAVWVPNAAILSGAYAVVRVADLDMMTKNILALKNKPGVADAMKALTDAADEARERS